MVSVVNHAHIDALFGESRFCGSGQEYDGVFLVFKKPDRMDVKC